MDKETQNESSVFDSAVESALALIPVCENYISHIDIKLTDLPVITSPPVPPCED